MKKEENLELIKKLSTSTIDTSKLQSSKHIGRSKSGSRNLLVKPQVAKKQGPYFRDNNSLSDSEDGAGVPLVNKNAQVKARDDFAGTASTLSTIGSGLKRPLDIGSDGMPIIKRRKRAPKAPFRPESFNFKDSVSEESGVEEGDIENRNKEDILSDACVGESESENKDASDDEDDEESASSEEDEDEDTEGSSESDENEDNTKKIKPRQSAFKAWASQQINEATGFQPSENIASFGSLPAHKSKIERPARAVVEDEPLPEELKIPTGDPTRKAFAVTVSRPESIQSARLGLPVVGEEQKIMEAIHHNSCVVIWGATGSGKTTQLPQFLFEAGFGNPESPNPGMIAVTQPRRVAAVSMANRVSTELGQFSDKVSYQIRFDTTVSDKTVIKFMTDGVLMREVAQDFALRKYSAIVVDEAHERSVNTDILIGMISRIIELRKSMSKECPTIKPLKLIIMSATLRVSDFLANSSLFKSGPPPLVQAEGRQYPVTIHFARRTKRDYVEEAFHKVSKGHRKLPPGGFLVFLTGQAEIKQLIRKLKREFKFTQESELPEGRVQMTASEAPLEAEDLDLGEANDGADGVDDEAGLDVSIKDGADDEDFDEEEGAMDAKTRIHILPLYSQLPTKEQLKVFDPVPDKSRLIVVATNVAETSLTIPGIRYVFDCGRSKEKQYDVSTGVQSFQVDWISKASASQRAGRAGRTGPGHCYRLYSSAIYEGELSEYKDPEILRTPIEGVVLQMKSMGLHQVINFPFPTPPSRTNLARAELLLKNLGAISNEGQIMDTGRHLSLYPLSPRFGKMLQIGYQHGCMPFVVAMVAALSVSELFIPESQLDGPAPKDETEVYTNAEMLADTEKEKRRKAYNKSRRIFSKYDERSEALMSMAAVCAYAYASDGEKFCSQMFLRQNAVKEASQLRHQVYNLVRNNNPGTLPPFLARLPEPSDKQLKALKQIVAAGFIDQVAIRADLAPTPPEMPRKPKRAIEVPYFPLFTFQDRPIRDALDRAVYVHPSSLLSRVSTSELPQYLIYSHLQQATPSRIVTTDNAAAAPKVRMFPLTPVSGLQLTALAHGTPLLEYGKPVGKIEPIAGGGAAVERRECWVVPSLVGDAGGMGWPLPAKKVVQRKDLKRGWVIDKFVT